MRGGKGLTTSEARSGGVEGSWPGSVGVVGKMELISRPPMSVVGRQKAPRMEDVNQKRKCTSAITPTARVG
jgi:hypothetical protein